jgi:hypothetical protein
LFLIGLFLKIFSSETADPNESSDKVYQLLAHGRWFSPASFITKTGHHDIAEILLKVGLNTINQIKS